MSAVPEGTIVVQIPITITFDPEELNTVVGALQLAPIPHKVSDPILKKIGKSAAEQCEKFAKTQLGKANGQKPDNGGTSNRRGKGSAGKAVPTVPG